MLPYILAAVGGYLIGQSRKSQQFADGGEVSLWKIENGDATKLKTGSTTAIKAYITKNKLGSEASGKYGLQQWPSDATEEEVMRYNKSNRGSATSQEYAKGGNISSRDRLEKELKMLQRQLSSPRLSTYREGDTSEQAMTLQKEREVKLARFQEVLDELNKFAKGGITMAVDKTMKLYHHKTDAGAEYLCSNKVKGTKDEGDLKSDICVRIDGAKTHGGELKMGDEKIKLYHHKTSGGAQYLCSSKVKGTKDEGDNDSKYVVRIDGAKTHGGELMIKKPIK